MKFEYPPGATPIDPDEAVGLIPGHLTLQRELNEYEEANILEASEWLFSRRRGDPLDAANDLRRRYVAALRAADTGDLRSLLAFLQPAADAALPAPRESR